MSVSCSDIRDLLRRDRHLDDAEVEVHLERCHLCSALLDDGAELGRSLATADPDVPAGPALDPLFEGLETSLGESEGGVGAWLHSRPSWMRYAFALAAIVGTAAISLLMRRGDLAEYPLTRLIFEVGILITLATISAWYWLRPLHRPRKVSAGVAGGFFVVLAVLVPVLFLVTSLGGGAVAAQGAGAQLAEGALACLSYGGALALPVALLLGALGRHGRVSWGFASLTISCGALAGLAALQLHCAMTHPLHLLLGHVLVPVAATGLWAIGRVAWYYSGSIET